MLAASLPSCGGSESSESASSASSTSTFTASASTTASATASTGSTSTADVSSASVGGSGGAGGSLAGGGGAAGQGGSGGDPATTTSASATTSTADVSTSASSTSSATTGSGGAGGVGTASSADVATSTASTTTAAATTSTGGPTCADAPCAQPGDADRIVNCDPSCGAVHAACSGICSSSAILSAYLGTTIIVVPALAVAEPACDAACGATGPAWTLRAQHKTASSCTTWEDPAGMPAAADLFGDQTDDPLYQCKEAITFCASADGSKLTKTGAAQWLYTVPREALPTGRMWFRQTTYAASTCPQPACPMTCNGAP
jgi:hypothetical protein